MIKYCVWDIGKVIYNFSFAPLDRWCRKNSTNLEGYEARRGQLEYNDYMRGEISFEEWCRRLCDLYYIPFSDNKISEISEVLHEGVSPYFPVTRKLMQKLEQMKIENCVLSNALPILADTDTGNFDDLVKPEHRFYSFEIGMLKPDAEIYEYVRRALNCKFEEIIFIDDKIENVNGAAALGIKAIVFNQNDIEEKLEGILNGL